MVQGTVHGAPASPEVSAGKAGHTASSEALAKEEGTGHRARGTGEERDLVDEEHGRGLFFVYIMAQR